MPIWLVATLQFLGVIWIEFAAILDYKLYKEEKLWWLFWNSLSMAAVGCFITIIYVDNRWLIISDCLGAGFGAVFASMVFPYSKTGKDL